MVTTPTIIDRARDRERARAQTPGLGVPVRLGLAACLALTAGCLQQLDRKDEVKDLRILAVKSEPAELVDNPLPAGVQFTALALDPRNDDPFDVQLEWTFCPVESDLFCRDYRERVQAGVDGAFSLDDLGGLPPGVIPGFNNCTPSNQTILGLAATAQYLGDVAKPDYLDRYRTPVDADTYSLNVGGGALQSIDLGFLASMSNDLVACGEPPPGFPLPSDTSDLHLYHFVTNPLESLLGAWPSVVLTARSGVHALVAEKRLPVVFRHPYNPLFLLHTFVPGLDLGVNICPPDESRPDCLAVEVHTANKNPVFDKIRWRRGHLAGGDEPFADYWTAADGTDPMTLDPIQVEKFGTLRIDPVFTPESEEPFQRFSVDANTGEVSVLDDKEVLSVSWFATSGGFRDEITWVAATKGLDNGYAAGYEPGIFHIFMVVRDQRGGTEWKGFRIEVTE